MLLNRAAERVHGSCTVSLESHGCTSTNIDDLVNELATLINSGDADSCRQAEQCAQLPGLASSNAEGLSQPAQLQQVVAAAISGRVVVGGANSEAPQLDAAVDPATTASGTTSVLVVRGEPMTPEDSTAGMYEADEEASTEKSLEYHLAVVSNTSAEESDRDISMDALLTALSGGYEPEMRLRIVKEILDKVDVGLLSLLATHVEEIRAEAGDFGKEDLVTEANRLLRRLQPALD